VTAPPTISIITPAYNASEFLSQTVASALAQTFRDFELLIVDDGSTDDTRNIALTWARTDPRIRILTRPLTRVASTSRCSTATICGTRRSSTRR